MGFRIITGSMGGGKSYFACEEMLRAIKEGAIVHTNLDIIAPEWVPHCEAPDQIVELGDHPAAWVDKIVPGLEGQENVVIIDEGALIFNSRDWNKVAEEKRVVFEFMVHSRHLGLDVMFITQAAGNVDKQIRAMAVGQVNCKKTVETKPFGFIFAALPPPFGGTFRRHLLSADGKTVHDSNFVNFKPDIGKLYKTHGRKESFSDKERDVRRRVKEDTSATGVKRGALFFGTIVALLVVGSVLAARSAYGRFAPAEPPAKPVVAPVTVVTPPLPETKGPIQAAVEAVKEPRFLPRRGSGRTHGGSLYVDLKDGTATVGEVYRDAVVISMSTKRGIITIYLDDGRKFETRPGTRQDFPPVKTNDPMNPWKKLPLPSSPFAGGSSPVSP